ncbi:hypothetical protein BURMUCF2_B0281 [Burkholderia multivorans CF2]|nr:hypothetical protein BURMUCF2_B0281 [Burkholderia multivorans CF2]
MLADARGNCSKFSGCSLMSPTAAHLNRLHRPQSVDRLFHAARPRAALGGKSRAR